MRARAARARVCVCVCDSVALTRARVRILTQTQTQTHADTHTHTHTHTRARAHGERTECAASALREGGGRSAQDTQRAQCGERRRQDPADVVGVQVPTATQDALTVTCERVCADQARACVCARAQVDCGRRAGGRADGGRADGRMAGGRACVRALVRVCVHFCM